MTDIPAIVQKVVSLRPYTSWLVGGDAEYFAMPENIDQIKSVYSWALGNQMPVSVISGGSNVLVADDGVPGLTICLKKFSGITKNFTEGDRGTCLVMEAFSGTSKAELLRIFLQHRLAPALFLAGIPGDVGGGVVMNAGVAESITPREFCEITDWIEVLTPKLELKKIEAKKLSWSYRHCQGWTPGIIVKVGISWQSAPNDQILVQVKEANRIRLAKQPLDMPSCGSVFKNPMSFKAAQLIDSCGLKGMRVGDAEISMKHANFIVNRGRATASDIWSLIIRVQQEVRQSKNVELVTEVIRLGKWGGTLVGVL